MLDASCEGSGKNLKLLISCVKRIFLFVKWIHFVKWKRGMVWTRGVGTRTDMPIVFLWHIYVAKGLRERLAGVLDRCKFFALQTDGITDSANMEEQLILAFYFNCNAECVCVCVCGWGGGVWGWARAGVGGGGRARGCGWAHVRVCVCVFVCSYL